MDDAEAAVGEPALPRLAMGGRVLRVRASDVARDLTAGVVAAVLLIANIVSFGALMFPGELADGAPLAVWAMLIGSCIGGLWIARVTSLPPLATGIDSPTGAVLVLVSAVTGSRVLKAGGSSEAVVQCVLLVFTVRRISSGWPHNGRRPSSRKWRVRWRRLRSCWPSGAGAGRRLPCRPAWS